MAQSHSACVVTLPCFLLTGTCALALRKALEMHAKVLCISDDSFAFVFQRPAPDDVHVLTSEELVALFPAGRTRDEAKFFVAHAVSGSVQSFPWPDDADALTTGMLDGGSS